MTRKIAPLPGSPRDVFSYFDNEKMPAVQSAVILWAEEGTWFISCSRMDIKEINYAELLLRRLVDQLMDTV